MNIENICKDLRTAANALAKQNALQKNATLEEVARCIQEDRKKILLANECDVKNARINGMTESLIERLSLNNAKIDDIIKSLHIVVNQTDPVGEILAGWQHPNGMQIQQVRVPIGVVAIIYESRPNVTVDAFCLAYKSGNALLLRGSSSALESNKALVASIKRALEKNGVPNAVYLSESTNHDDVQEILNAVGKIDVAIPRGGKNLIQSVIKNARIPVIETGSGVCHLFVDESADLQNAVTIAENAKKQRTGACNAIECILVHKKIANEFLPLLVKKFGGSVLLKADKFCLPILQQAVTSNRASMIGIYGYDCVVPALQDD
ncbi:MAG: glutamate-5-semialdehyde dehydrogenase, partial [Treponema sp.]|nr:glutamate-5-semialdehyde dehydrogenase [Treponema sp.]